MVSVIIEGLCRHYTPVGARLGRQQEQENPMPGGGGCPEQGVPEGFSSGRTAPETCEVLDQPAVVYKV